jgi:uncharacterized OB-fold protein
MTAINRPVPVVEPWSAAYWQGAQRHELVLMRCEDCSYYEHPPRPTCSRCQSERLAPETVSGLGTIYSFSVMRRPGNPGFDELLPYAVVIVDLDEQPGLRAAGNLPGVPIDEIRIGMRVEVDFDDVSADITLPQWRPATAAQRSHEVA